MHMIRILLHHRPVVYPGCHGHAAGTELYTARHRDLLPCGIPRMADHMGPGGGGGLSLLVRKSFWPACHGIRSRIRRPSPRATTGRLFFTRFPLTWVSLHVARAPLRQNRHHRLRPGRSPSKSSRQAARLMSIPPLTTRWGGRLTLPSPRLPVRGWPSSMSC